MNSEKQKYVELIAKLVSKEKSVRTLGNIDEAEAFATKVQELLKKYELSMSDVEFAEHRSSETVEEELIDWTDFGFPCNRLRRCGWKEALTTMVANENGCEVLVYPRSDRLCIIGRPQLVKITTYLVGTLCHACDRMAQTSYDRGWFEAKARGNTPCMSGYKASFIRGFLIRIYVRYESRRTIHNESKALVRLSTELRDAKNYIEEKGVHTASRVSLPLVENADALMVGYEAGGFVSIDANAIESPKNSRKIEA